jgi:hypothetical protein
VIKALVVVELQRCSCGTSDCASLDRIWRMMEICDSSDLAEAVEAVEDDLLST